MSMIKLFLSAIRSMGLQQACRAYMTHFLLKRENKQAIKKFHLRNGVSVYLRPSTSDWYVLRQVFFREDYAGTSHPHEDRLDLFYQDILAQGRTPCIIDCGANIGLASLWYSKRYPAAKIIAIEPEPYNYDVLVLNASGRHNIIPVQAAISDSAGSVMLSNPDGSAWAWQTVKSDSGSTRALTIDDLLSQVPSATPLIVKVDIEGFETELMRSNLAWVDRTPLVVFESHDWMMPWSGTGHAFFSALVSSKRDYLMHGENTFAYSHALLAPRS